MFRPFTDNHFIVRQPKEQWKPKVEAFNDLEKQVSFCLFIECYFIVNLFGCIIEFIFRSF